MLHINLRQQTESFFRICTDSIFIEYIACMKSHTKLRVQCSLFMCSYIVRIFAYTNIYLVVEKLFKNLIDN